MVTQINRFSAPLLLLFMLLALTTKWTIVQGGNSCSSRERDLVGLCTVDQARHWNITHADHATSSRKFCCFIWDALKCQVAIASKCDSEWAHELSDEAERAYRTTCILYPRSAVKTKCVNQTNVQKEKKPKTT